MRRIRNALILVAILLAACTLPGPHALVGTGSGLLDAEPWHEADRLFFDNPGTPEWKGADVANSVALGDGRVLWVFGDTLLAQPGVNSCERFDSFKVTVHNSLALQYGTDPTTSRIRHFWGKRAGQPDSFFQPQDGSDGWYWMGGVTVIDDQVLIFLMRARSTPPAAPGAENAPSCAGLDFEMLGWDARIATITPQDPDQWQWRTVLLPDEPDWHGIIVGSSTVSVEGDYLYAWSSGPAAYGGNPVFLARWPLAIARVANLQEPQWYTDTGWRTQGALGSEAPSAIVQDGNNEVSISNSLWPSDRQSWWWLQSSEIVNSTLCYRNAQSRFDFGECHAFMTPPELEKYPDSTLLVYAAKFHPALTTASDTAIATYVVNSCDLKDIQEKCDLYYPRFIRLRRHSHTAAGTGDR